MIKRFALRIIGLIAMGGPSLVLAQSITTLPQANFTVSPATGEATTRFTFDGSDSSGSNGQNSSLEYRWQFRSGRDYTPFSSSPRTTYVPLDDGTFRARLQVRDRRTGQVQTTFRTYRANTSIPRRASLFVDPLNPKAGEVVNFRVEVFKVRNEDIDDIEVRWDFDGDGTFDTQFQPQKETSYAFGFTQIQRIRPRAEVRFADGSTVSVRGIRPAKGGRFRTPDRLRDYGTLSVKAPVVVAPIVQTSPGPFAPTVNTQFTFDASKSLIPRGGRIEWSFDDSAFEKGGKVFKKTFDSSGKHTVKVRTCVGITNPECAVSQTSVEIKDPPTQFFIDLEVNEVSNSDQKLTRISDQYFQGAEGLTVRFSATSQTSSGNESVSNLSYRWDFDGNGKFDTIASRSRLVQYQFDRVGRFTPTVEAISPQGVKQRASVIVDIAQNTFPTGEIRVSPGDLFVGETIRFTPVVSDAETQSGDLEVRFDLNGDNIWDGGFRKSTSAAWRYASSGAYLIRMQIRDANGKTTIVKKEINVRPDPKLLAFGIGQSAGGGSGTTSGDEGTNASEAGGNSDTASEAKSSGGSSSGGRVSGQRELRIPIAAPEFKIHQDYKNYIEYATGFERGSQPTPTATNPWVVGAGSSAGSASSGSSTGAGTGSSSANSGTSSSLGNNTGGQTNNTPSQGQTGSQQAGQPSFTSVAGSATSAQPVNSFLQGIIQKYKGQRIRPAYPGENPFTDITESDPNYLVAIQAYRDGAVKGPRFYWK